MLSSIEGISFMVLQLTRSFHFHEQGITWQIGNRNVLDGHNLYRLGISAGSRCLVHGAFLGILHDVVIFPVVQ